MSDKNIMSEWYRYNGFICCRACHYISPKVMIYDAAWGKWKEEQLLSNYCPNCGRHMKKENIKIYD